MNHGYRTLMLAALAATAAACSDAAGPEDLGTATLSIAAVPSTSAAAAPGLFGAATYTGGNNTIVLTRVVMVLREIELKRALVDDCDSAGPGEDDDCEEFETGPLLLEVPLDGQVATVVSIDIPADTYDELEFDVHKPEDSSPEDQAFLQAHPEFKGVSVRVEGTFNGEPFVFLQDLNEEQEVDLVPPLTIAEGESPANLTLTLDLDGWFRTSTGDLVDPRLANKGGNFEGLVEANIRRSIEAFEDHDRDGHKD